MRKIFCLVFLLASACHSQRAVQSFQKVAPDSLGLNPSVYFQYNEDTLADTSIIIENARWLKNHPDRVVILEGHCDERGTPEYNILLGDRRARAVMKALMDHGVGENQLIIMSYGKGKPIIKEHHEKGWAQNRRVDFVLR